jgi:hypothetical protein
MNDVIEVDHKNHYRNNFDCQKEFVVREGMEEVDNRSHQILQENQNLVRIDHHL